MKSEWMGRSVARGLPDALIWESKRDSEVDGESVDGIAEFGGEVEEGCPLLGSCGLHTLGGGEYRWHFGPCLMMIVLHVRSKYSLLYVWLSVSNVNPANTKTTSYSHSQVNDMIITTLA